MSVPKWSLARPSRLGYYWLVLPGGYTELVRVVLVLGHLNVMHLGRYESTRLADAAEDSLWYGPFCVPDLPAYDTRHRPCS